MTHVNRLSEIIEQKKEKFIEVSDYMEFCRNTL